MLSWQDDRAIALLCEGYGVEDIAVRIEVGADDVRALVADLRKDGTLPLIYEDDPDAVMGCSCGWRGSADRCALMRCPACGRLSAMPLSRGARKAEPRRE